MRRHLEQRGLWSDAHQREHDAATLAEIDSAIESAEKLPPPALTTLFDDVYAAVPPALEEERARLLALPRAQGLAKP